MHAMVYYLTHYLSKASFVTKVQILRHAKSKTQFKAVRIWTNRAKASRKQAVHPHPSSSPIIHTFPEACVRPSSSTSATSMIVRLLVL